MTKLKTLKDFDYSLCTNFGVKAYQRNNYELPITESWEETTKKISIDDLKQEAIKHIKHIEKDIDDVIKKINYVNGLDKELEAQITWIKMFFNITKEDLK